MKRELVLVPDRVALQAILRNERRAKSTVILVTVVPIHKRYYEHMKYRIPYIAMTAGGVVGLVASFLQMIEKLTLLSHAHQALVCDLNSYFSCSTVLNAWQSSVFGFPNSMMCMIFFTIFATIGLVGLSGGALPRRLRLGVQTLALFVLAFGLWFLWQSVYSIGSVCVLCLFCFSGLLLVNWSWPFQNKMAIFGWGYQSQRSWIQTPDKRKDFRGGSADRTPILFRVFENQIKGITWKDRPNRLSILRNCSKTTGRRHRMVFIF